MNQRSIFHNFFLCCPSQRSARSQVPSQVATHQEMGNQLWAGETPDSNPGLQDNSLAHYHWATTPPKPLSHHASQLSHHASHFGIFFLHNKIISETFFTAMKRFWIINWRIKIRFIRGFPKYFYVLDVGFQNSFITTAAAFQHGFCQSEHPMTLESR